MLQWRNARCSFDNSVTRENGMMENIYFYKMTTDCGAAPCVDNGKLSLAICKPSIRKKAGAGDIVFGFG